MNIKIVQVISVKMLATIFISATSQPGFASASVPMEASGKAMTQPAGPAAPQEMEAFLIYLTTAKL